MFFTEADVFFFSGGSGQERQYPAGASVRRIYIFPEVF